MYIFSLYKTYIVYVHILHVIHDALYVTYNMICNMIYIYVYT